MQGKHKLKNSENEEKNTWQIEKEKKRHRHRQKGLKLAFFGQK